MNKKIAILIIPIFFLFSFSICLAQTEINDEEKEVASLKLKTGQIIDHQEVKEIKNILDFEKSVSIISYTYIGQEVDDAKNIIFDKNSNYSNTLKLNENNYRIYTSPQFFKDDNNFVHKIETKTTTKEIWDKASVQTLVEKITSILKTPYAIAGTTYIVNDSYIGKFSDTSWYDVRTAEVGDIINPNSIVAFNWEYLGSEYYNFRTTINFDLSLIDQSNILSGSLNLYAYEGDPLENEHSYGFFKGTQSLPSIVDDYNNFETTPLTNIIQNSDVLSDGFTNWILNNDGINYLKTGSSSLMFIETIHDIGSTTPPDITDLTGRSFVNSLNENLLQHPYIELTISSATTTATTTASIGNDIGIIYYNATTTQIDDNTSVTSATYNIPFFLFKFVYMIMTICFIAIIAFLLSFLKKNKN